MAIVHQRGWAPQAFRESGWYAPLAGLWQSFERLAQFPTPAELSVLYARETAALLDLPEAAKRLHFVATPPKKKRHARRAPVDLASLYEGRIALQHEVPTRLDDWHDFFNALTFIAFPRAKWALHTRQFARLRARLVPGAKRLPGARSREQDALSLLDEGGIALLVRPELARTLDAESATFNTDCEALCRVGEARAVPFGHALPEHLVEGLPLPLGTAHVLALDFQGLANKALFDAVDLALSRELSQAELFLTPSPARGLSLHAICAD